MITICITICIVALLICATIGFVCYEPYLSDIDAGDVSKLKDIHIICDYMLEQELLSKENDQFFDMRKYKDIVEEIYNITKTYK